MRTETVLELCSSLSRQLGKENVFCLVGSGVFEIIGGRPARDVDIVLHPLISIQDGKKVATACKEHRFRKVSIIEMPYSRSGITDSILFTVPHSYPHPAGFRVARPELEFSRKTQMMRRKDVEDIENMIRLVSTGLPSRIEISFPKWDWLLATEPALPSQTSLVGKFATAKKLALSRPVYLATLFGKYVATLIRVSLNTRLVRSLGKYLDQAFLLQLDLSHKEGRDLTPIKNSKVSLRKTELEELEENLQSTKAPKVRPIERQKQQDSSRIGYLKRSGALVPFIIWPKALSYSEEILSSLKEEGLIFDFQTKSPSFDGELDLLIQSVYSLDGLSQWGIERKKSLVGGGWRHRHILLFAERAKI